MIESFQQFLYKHSTYASKYEVLNQWVPPNFSQRICFFELFLRNFGIFHVFLRTTFASKCCALANAFENKKLQNRVKNIFRDTFFNRLGILEPFSVPCRRHSAGEAEYINEKFSKADNGFWAAFISFIQ